MESTQTRTYLAVPHDEKDEAVRPQENLKITNPHSVLMTNARSGMPFPVPTWRRSNGGNLIRC